MKMLLLFLNHRLWICMDTHGVLIFNKKVSGINDATELTAFYHFFYFVKLARFDVVFSKADGSIKTS